MQKEWQGLVFLHITSSTQRKTYRHKGVLVQRYLAVIRLSGGGGNGDKRRRPGRRELDFITINSYSITWAGGACGKENGNKRRSVGSKTRHVTWQEREPTDNRQEGKRPQTPRQSPKARSGKELVRCVQHEAIDECAPKDKGRTYDEPLTALCHIRHRWEPHALENS